MEQPGIEHQAKLLQALHAGADRRVEIEAGPRHAVAVADDGIGIPAGGIADAAEAPAAGGDLGFQHGGHAIAQGEVGKAHDAAADARRPVAAAVAHGGDAGHELDLAHRLHLLGPARAVHRAAFLEHRGHDVVPGVQVGQQLVEQIAEARHVPQMMVGVDDRQLGLEDRLGRRLGVPGVVGLEDAAKARRLAGIARALEHRAEAGGGLLRHGRQPSAIRRARAAGSLSIG